MVWATHFSFLNWWHWRYLVYQLKDGKLQVHEVKVLKLPWHLGRCIMRLLIYFCMYFNLPFFLTPSRSIENLLAEKLELGHIKILGRVTTTGNSSHTWISSALRVCISPIISCVFVHNFLTRISFKGLDMPLHAYKRGRVFSKIHTLTGLRRNIKRYIWNMKRGTIYLLSQQWN